MFWRSALSYVAAPTSVLKQLASVILGSRGDRKGLSQRTAGLAHVKRWFTDRFVQASERAYAKYRAAGSALLAGVSMSPSRSPFFGASVSPVRSDGPMQHLDLRSASPPLIDADSVDVVVTPSVVRSSAGVGLRIPRFLMVARVALHHEARVRAAAFAVPRFLHTPQLVHVCDAGDGVDDCDAAGEDVELDVDAAVEAALSEEVRRQ